jgi:uncharacterized membrane protein
LSAAPSLPPPDAGTARPPSAAFRNASAAFVACVAALIAFTAATGGWNGIFALAASSGSVFISKLAIFAGAIEQHPHGPWELAVIAWLIDVGWALALLGGLSWMERLPVVERYLGRAHQHAERMALEYPGIRRLASAGVALFVFVPVPGTGAIAGTLLGSLLGLSRSRCLASVAVGSALAVVVFAALATLFGARWQAIVQNPVTSLLGLAALVLFAHLAWVRAKRSLRRGP